MKTETIELENMLFRAFHGCYDAEKLVGNMFNVYLKITCDAEAASKSDNVNDTVSYLSVYELVRHEMMITSNILEHICVRILRALKAQHPQILSASIKISKLNPPLGGEIEKVSVTMNDDFHSAQR